VDWPLAKVIGQTHFESLAPRQNLLIAGYGRILPAGELDVNTRLAASLTLRLWFVELDLQDLLEREGVPGKVSVDVA
jgi:hypothetical protein